LQAKRGEKISLEDTTERKKTYSS